MLKLVGRLVISSPQLDTQGEINKVSWMVGTDFGSEIADCPDKIEGGQHTRNWITNSGYFGKVITLGNEKLSPLKLTFNALTEKEVEKLRFYYTRRKYVIAEYREFKGRLARIANMKVNPVRGTKYFYVLLTITEVPAFRVYRSVDYGETYQQASDRVNTEFHDYGFVYAGQVRYRIQYDPPDVSPQFDGIEVFGETETLRVSRVDIPPSEPYDLPVANVSGSMKVADTFITGSISEPPPPTVDGFYHDYIPKPKIQKIEGSRLYTTYGIRPAIKVFIEYPTNAFSDYPDTEPMKLTGVISIAGRYNFEEERWENFFQHKINGLPPFTVEVPTYGTVIPDYDKEQMYIASHLRMVNLYGESVEVNENHIFPVVELPYNDLVKTFVSLSDFDIQQKHTVINGNNSFEEIHIPKNPIIADNFSTTSIKHTPPDFDKLNAGTFTEEWVNTPKDIYLSDFEQNSIYEDIHYT